MFRQQILQGLALSEDASSDLALYYRIAKEQKCKMAIINEMGYLLKNGYPVWKRPVASDKATSLREELLQSAPMPDGIKVEGTIISINMSQFKLEYNMEWVKSHENVGFKEVPGGVTMYAPSIKRDHYTEKVRLYGISLKELGARKRVAVPFDPRFDNPDEAEWGYLNFLA